MPVNNGRLRQFIGKVYLQLLTSTYALGRNDLWQNVGGKFLNASRTATVPPVPISTAPAHSTTFLSGTGLEWRPPIPKCFSG